MRWREEKNVQVILGVNRVDRHHPHLHHKSRTNFQSKVYHKYIVLCSTKPFDLFLFGCLSEMRACTLILSIFGSLQHPP